MGNALRRPDLPANTAVVINTGHRRLGTPPPCRARFHAGRDGSGTNRHLPLIHLRLVFGLVLGCVGMAAPGTRADTAGMQPTPDADAARLSAQDAWNGPGDLYRIIASSAGVLAGAGLMSVFIDGWVLDAFTSNSGLSAREAAAVVRDLESQGGIERADVVGHGQPQGTATFGDGHIGGRNRWRQTGPRIGEGTAEKTAHEDSQNGGGGKFDEGAHRRCLGSTISCNP